MKRMHEYGLKYSGFFAAGVAAVLITVAAVSAVSSDEGPALRVQALQNQQHLRETFTRELELPVGASLNIHNESGRVTIAGWDGDTVAIRVEKRLDLLDGYSSWFNARPGPPPGLTEEDVAFFESMDLEVRVDETGLNIRSVRDAFAPDVNFAFHMDVKVPRGTRLNVRVESGPVNIQGVEAHVAAETGNGKLSCEDISGAVDVRTHNGGIFLRAIEGTIAAQATNGPVVLDERNMTTAYAIHCETDNGAITLSLPGNPSFELSANTSNGYVKTRLEVAGQVPAGAVRSLAGPVGAGGPIVDLRTLNGSIYLDES
ncbi:MAG: DUF4097 family beta strand repeat protein [Candidatus Hydrogenedentes bacterium]|nr:DUF4097 family beta strand repeat protein [Candidatus Hydrogenedentota bacterium]